MPLSESPSASIQKTLSDIETAIAKLQPLCQITKKDLTYQDQIDLLDVELALTRSRIHIEFLLERLAMEEEFYESQRSITDALLRQ